MSIARAFFGFLCSRYTLGIVIMVALGLVLWFGGPHVGLGNARPLASAHARILVLILSLSFVLFWLLHWPISIVGVAALSLLIWHGFPLLHVDQSYPFAPESVRIVSIGLLLFFFALYLLYRLWLALRANDALLQKILHPGKHVGTSPAQEQLQEVKGVMQQAMRQLRSLLHLDGTVQGTWRARMRGMFQHARYIYELPWYMILGAPGTGKTTAILNSGLQFPLSEQSGNLSLAGISGTRNCLWWFTSEAVIIDTAGRYATHESDPQVDNAEWKGFLGLLRRFRPRAPINGAILAVNAEDLAARNTDELRQLAAQLRARLAELQDELRIAFPVYVLITKMDLIKGFPAYFHHLNTQGRAQVLGFTLPLPQRKASRPRLDVRTQCQGEMRLLHQRLEQGLDARLREEYDQEKRRNMYCLPGEFDALCQPLLQLIDDIFFEPGHSMGVPEGAPQAAVTSGGVHHLLRGVYFTSAVQQEGVHPAEPNTFLQRVRRMAHVGQDMLRRGQARPTLDSRSFFLQQVLRKVIFPESFLVQRNRRWEMRFRLARSLGHVLLILLGAVLTGALLTSEANNAALLHDMGQRTEALTQHMKKTTPDARLENMPSLLQESCTLTEYSDLDLLSPPLAYGGGLFAAAPVADAADHLCRTLRHTMLLPLVAQRLEDNLRASLAAATQSGQGQEQQRDKSRQVYEALHLYSAFYKPEHYQAAALLHWLHQDMAADAQHVLTRHGTVLEHLKAVLQEPDFPRPGTIRDDLRAAARRHLASLSKAERLYILARHSMTLALPANVEDFIPAKAAGDASALYRNDGKNLSSPIPAFYTYAGYHQVFAPALPAFLSEAATQDAWLMGEASPDKASSSLHKDLQRAIRLLYFEDYSAHWQQLVQAVRLSLGTEPERAISLLAQLSSAASPLDKLGRAVVLETSLSAPEAPPSLPGVSSQEGSKGAGLLNTAAKVRAVVSTPDLDMTRLVDRPFADLRTVVTGTARTDKTRTLPPSPTLQELHGLFAEYALHLQSAFKGENRQNPPPPNDIAERMRAKARTLPPFYSAVLDDLAQQGHAQEGAAKARTLAKVLNTEVSEPCRKLVQGNYPFTPQGKDADAVEFARIFGPQGVLDNYFTQHLADMVDTSSSPWRYINPIENAPSLRPFEQAARIRKALFRPNDAKGWTLEYVLEVAEMDPRLERLTLTLGEKRWHYEHGPVLPLEARWDGMTAKGRVELDFRPRTGIRPVRLAGPWALLRLLDMGSSTANSTPEQAWMEYDLNGYQLTLSVQNPEDMPRSAQYFEDFQCPQELP